MSTQRRSQAPAQDPQPLPQQAPPGSYQGHVIQDEPKGGCSLREVIAHLSGDQLSLGDQFSSIKASLVPKEGRGASQDDEEAERPGELPAMSQPAHCHSLPAAYVLGAGLQAEALSLTTTDLRISVVMDGSTRSS